MPDIAIKEHTTALPAELSRIPRKSDPAAELAGIFPDTKPVICHFADESGVNTDKPWVALPAFGAGKLYPQLRGHPRSEALRAAALMHLIMGDEIPMQAISCLPLDIQPPDKEEQEEIRRGEKDVSMVSLSVGGSPDKPWYIAMDEEALRMHPEALDALRTPWEHPLGYGLKEKLEKKYPPLKNPDTKAPDAAAKYLFACADMIDNHLAKQIMQGAEMPAWLEFMDEEPVSEIKTEKAQMEKGVTQKRMRKTYGMAAQKQPTSKVKSSSVPGDYSATIG